MLELLDGQLVHGRDVVVVEIQRCQIVESAHEIHAERAQVIVAQIQLGHTEMEGTRWM